MHNATEINSAFVGFNIEKYLELSNVEGGHLVIETIVLLLKFVAWYFGVFQHWCCGGGIVWLSALQGQYCCFHVSVASLLGTVVVAVVLWHCGNRTVFLL
jgi:hypothetical protein